MIEQFRRYLDESPLKEANQKELNEGTDLHALFTELTALRTEVKQESRQFKGALDHFRVAFDALQTSYADLATEAQQRQNETQQQQRDILRPVLQMLLEQRDRMAEALAMMQAHRPSLLGRFCKKEMRVITSWREGQDMALRRLDQLLAKHNVQPINVVGEKFTPTTMCAVEVESREGLAEGMVIAELRKGFKWNDELLRVAEVKVNRPKGKHHE